MQVIITTCDKTQNRVLPGFAHLFNKYWSAEQQVLVCGFTPPTVKLPSNFSFWSIGDFAQFPSNRWSDAFRRILDNVAEEHFVLMLDDYYLVRHVDTKGVNILYDYARQFRYVLKVDLCYDRMGNDWGRYMMGFNNYGVAGHLDLIYSPPGSTYQMSLWGGLWNRDLVREFIIPGETAQEIEMRGTERVNSRGNQVVVLGTRQAPMIHANILQSGSPGKFVYDVGGWAVDPADLKEMSHAGVAPK